MLFRQQLCGKVRLISFKELSELETSQKLKSNPKSKTEQKVLKVQFGYKVTIFWSEAY